MKKTTILFLLILPFFGKQVLAQGDTAFDVVDIGNNSDFKGFQVLDAPIKGKRLVFSGVVNSYANFNSKFEFKLLKYLNRNAGFNNYLLEIGPAKAYLVNQFVNSADSTTETLLQSVSSYSAMRMYRNLKKLNKSLPDSAKIKVYGVDIERYSSLPLIQMSQLLPKDSIPDQLRIAVEALHGAAKYIVIKGLENYEREKNGTEYSYYYQPSAFSIRQSVDEFLRFYDSLKPAFQTWLGKNFEQVETSVGLMKENKAWAKYYYSAFQFPMRENLMFTRINALLKSMPDAKFYGQFELCRVSKEVLEKGCDFYNFSGVLNRLLTNEESACKDILNIGVFYKREVQISEALENTNYQSEYQETVHHTFEKELNAWFDSMPDASAGFAMQKPWHSKRDSALFANYSVLFLNKNLPLPSNLSDASDADSTASLNKRSSSWLDDYDKARVYLGVMAHNPYVQLGTMNGILVANGFDGINNLMNFGSSLVFASADRSVLRYSWAQGNSGNNYSNFQFSMGSGYNFIYKTHFKMGILSDLAYVKHRLTLVNANNNQAFFSTYIPPKIYTNPALLISISSSAFYEIGPFYLYAEGGRQWDLGSSRWKYNGQLAGSTGGLSNTAWFLNAGLGVAFKMEWLGL